MQSKQFILYHVHEYDLWFKKKKRHGNSCVHGLFHHIHCFHHRDCGYLFDIH